MQHHEICRLQCFLGQFSGVDIVTDTGSRRTTQDSNCHRYTHRYKWRQLDGLLDQLRYKAKLCLRVLLV